MTDTNQIYDVIVIGAGPAGLTAAIYTSRRQRSTLVLSKDIGGQATWTPDIENYPGYDKISGAELTQKFKAQAEKFGAKFVMEEAEEIIEDAKKFFHVRTASNTFYAHSVVLAFGLSPRNLNVPGEEELKGKGVAYCATCDALFYRGKTVAVVGGGNSGMDAALLLSKVASKVYLIHNSDQLRGEVVLMQKIKDENKIEVVFNSATVRIDGKEKVESITLKNISNEEDIRELKVDGVFVEIGYQTATSWVKDLVKLNDKGEIITDKDCKTSLEGVFAAGDVADIIYKQVVISAGEGAKAGLQADTYLSKTLNEKTKAQLDWGKQK